MAIENYVPSKNDYESAVKVLEITRRLKRDLDDIQFEGSLYKCFKYVLPEGLKESAGCIFALINTAQVHFEVGVPTNGTTAEQNIDSIKQIIESKLKAN